MTQDEKTDRDFEDLRRQAERLVQRLSSDQDVSALSAQDIRHLIHELQVHQTELELQNEELRRAQLELERSRDRLADLYDFAPVGYFTLDRRGVILEANLSGAVLVNRERRSLIKKPFVSLVSTDDYRTFFSYLANVFATRVKQTCELLMKSGVQGHVYVRMESIVTQSDSGKEDTCSTAVSDISEVKRIEEKAFKVQERVLNSMVEGVCVCDETGLISFTNPALDTMLGYDRNELLGKNLAELENCVQAANVRLGDILRHSVEKGLWRGEYRCEKKDGTILDVHMRITLAELLQKRNLIVIWQDITQLRKAEQSLLDSDRRFKAIFESATDLIYLKDRSLRYTHVNPAFERLLGKPAEDIVGLQYEELFGEEGSAYDKDVDIRVLGGQTVEEECIKQINGLPSRFHEVRAPLRDGKGEVVGICGIARDITERSAREFEPRKEVKPPSSKPMRAALQLALRAAKRGSVVLLRGESGSGKDYLARFIHDQSDRSGGPYFSINCAAVTPDLAESELFGHERGSFTGAHARKRGLLELAEGGTLLLNEIGDLSLPLQAKLLTFLDTRKLLRVGAQEEISVNARLIAATNKDLEAEVEAGRFRQDLYYRLSVMVIEVPPLRSRAADIPDLVENIVGKLAAELRLSNIPHFDSEAIRSFQKYQWPGNVRELRNVLERTLILGEVPPLCGASPVPEQGQGDYSITLRFESGRTLHDLTDEVTRGLCIEAMERCHGNKKEAARLLGIARDSLYRHLKRFEIE